MGGFLNSLLGNKKVEVKKEEVKSPQIEMPDYGFENEWGEDSFEEGQLSVDVYETPKEIVVKSTIAGVKPEDIDISINDDMLTIRGHRHIDEEIEEDDYLYQECYWGSFSRSIILPTEIRADKIDAILESGVLTVKLPKAKPKQELNIKVKEK